MALGTDGKIDTPIELEYCKLQTKVTIVKLIMRYIILILAMAVSLTIGLIFDGDYATYSYLVVLAIVSYELGTNGNGIKEIFQKILNK